MQKKFINKSFPYFLFLVSASFSLTVLLNGSEWKLFGLPTAGTDQLSMINAAVELYHGRMPDAGYMYSPSYTIFLYCLVLVSNGSIFAMRLIQALICALVPVFVYKLSRRLRLGAGTARCASLLFCFYGPATLMSLSMLRAMPLALCFLLYTYSLTRAFCGKSWLRFALAGFLAGLCILGRENFIPVVLAPLALLFFSDIRKYMRKEHFIAFGCTLLMAILPILLYNLIRFDSLSIVPGHVKNVIGAHHGEKASHDLGTAIASLFSHLPHRAWSYISSYELDNSVSFYAHCDVILPLRLLFVPYNALFALACVALAWNYTRRSIQFVALLVIAYIATMLPFDPFYRFRIPLVPLLSVLAGAGLILICRGKGLTGKIAPLLLALIVFCLTWTSSGKLRRVNERYAVVRIFLINRRFDLAEAYIKKLEQEEIPVRQVRLQLIRALFQSGKTEEANAQYRQLMVDDIK